MYMLGLPFLPLGCTDRCNVFVLKGQVANAILSRGARYRVDKVSGHSALPFIGRAKCLLLFNLFA